MKRKIIHLLSLLVAFAFALSANAQHQANTLGSYCIPSANCNSGTGFSDFAWAGIENYGSGCSPGGYGDFTYMEASVEIGQSYTATFASGARSQMVSMWIDFNKDYEFSANERILTDFKINEANAMHFVNILIPDYALPGNTTMRIASHFGNPSSPDPCATFPLGEFEDYSVEITGTPIYLNAAVISIDFDPLTPSGDITVKAKVKNFCAETISFPVTMTVAEAGYSKTVQVTALSPGDLAQIEFDTWNVPAGAYEIAVCTELSGDEIPDNDCMSVDISNLEYDAGVTEINIAPLILAGNMIPKATVKNYGSATISFPVTLTIDGTNYSSTIDVVGLKKGKEVTVEFDAWLGSPGQYTVEACTGLSNEGNAKNDCSDMLVTVTENTRQKAVVELFTGTWCGYCPYAELGLHEMHNEFPETLAAIAWHVTDDFTIPAVPARHAWYKNEGCPTTWFDGKVKLTGGSTPSNYSRYLPVFEQRMSTPVNFRINMELSHINASDYKAKVSFEILEGVNTENLSAFIALTETGIPFTGLSDQIFVARSVWPNATVGQPMDFSSQSVIELETTVTPKASYVLENCEVVVWLQNMDTKEIYQGTSLMLTDIVGMKNLHEFVGMEVYPNPASDRVTIKSASTIENLEIYNQLGQLVKQHKVNSNLVNLDVSGLNSGIYFIKAYSSNKVSTRKLVIE